MQAYRPAGDRHAAADAAISINPAAIRAQFAKPRLV